MARFLGAFFRASGMNLEHCDPDSVDEAIDEVIDRQADCVLLDLRLGDLDGFDILEAMRQNEHTASIPVIIITGDFPAEARPRAAALDAAIVRKPFDVRDVFDLVRELIGDDAEAPTEQPLLTQQDEPAPQARMLSITDLQVLLAGALDGSHHSVGLAVVRLRAVDGRPPAQSAVEVAAHGLDRAIEDGEVLGCSDADEVAVLYLDVDSDLALADLEIAIGHLVGCTGYAGLAQWPEQATTADELSMAADAAAMDAADEGKPVRLAR